jgi:hypothetical protein
MGVRVLVAGTLALAAGLLGPVGAVSAGLLIAGPGVNIGENQLDNGGTRLNVDLTNPFHLSPGTYTAQTFTFDAGTTGTAQPFLATVTGTPGSGSETYHI